MTSRPAAPDDDDAVRFAAMLINTPKSETPESDAQFKATEAIDEITPAAIAFVKLARSLERRLSISQTEIKGHMRVEDELKATVASLERKLDDIVNTMKNAGMEVPGWIEHTDQDGKLRRDNLTIAATLMFELEAWQARIAALEKDAARYRFLRENVRAHDRMVGYCIRAWTFDAPCDIVTLDAAIDAALKSRA